MERNSKMSKAAVNKILSIGLAIVLWIVVIGGENPIKDRTIHSIPVQLKNLETLAENNLAIAGDTEYTVDVKIKGQRTTVDPLTVQDITVEADLFGYGKGQNYINVTARIPDNTELVEIRSPRIQVVIEDLVAVSKPVNISFKDVPAGKEVGGLILQPMDVEVSGAKSLVDAVAWAFGTVDTDDYVEGEANTVQVELQPLNDGEVMVENVRMSSQYVDVTYTIMDVKEVQLVVDPGKNPDADWVLDEITAPETIKVRGLANALEAVDRVVTEPLDLETMEVDETGHAVLPLKPILPEGVELSRDNVNLECTVHLKDVVSETISYGGDDIAVVGLPEEVEAFVDPGMYNVIIKAEEFVMETLEKGDILLEADGSGLEDETLIDEGGIVELPIRAVYEKAFDEVIVIPETVKVHIRQTGR